MSAYLKYLKKQIQLESLDPNCDLQLLADLIDKARVATISVQNNHADNSSKKASTGQNIEHRQKV